MREIDVREGSWRRVRAGACLLARRSAWLWAALALSACGSAGEAPETVAADDLPERAAPGGEEVGKADFAASALLWRDLEIGVCWEADAMAPTAQEARRQVQDAVAGSWAAVSAVDFVGWGPCADDAAGVRIGLTDTAPHTLGLGTQLDGVPNGMRLNFTFDSWSTGCQQTPTTCIRAGAIHEFGHALGLAHEQNRQDTPGWCDGERGAFGDLSFTDWDLDSIMNYCNPEWTGGGDLSASDVIAIRALYGLDAGTSIVALGDGANLRPQPPTWDATLASDAMTYALGDVTGDALADLVAFDASSGRWWVRRGGRQGLGPAERFAAWTGTEGATALVGDMDGDGLADAIDVTPDGAWTVGRSGHGAFAAPQWIGQSEVRGLPRVGDLDGDGRDDAVVVDPDSGRWWVARSVGTGLAPFERWLDDHGAGATAHLVADVTGDGLADLVAVRQDGGRWEVAISGGDHAAPPRLWAEDHGALATTHLLADVDGDGRGDALVYEGARGRWFARLAAEDGFGEERYLGEYVGASRREVAPIVGVGDMDGDADDDVVLIW